MRLHVTIAKTDDQLLVVCPPSTDRAEHRAAFAAVVKAGGKLKEGTQVREIWHLNNRRGTEKRRKFDPEREARRAALADHEPSRSFSSGFTEAAPAKEEDLSDWKLDELRDLAEAEGVDHRGLRKADLIAALEAHQPEPTPED